MVLRTNQLGSKREIRITFIEEGERFNTNELVDYLQLLKGCYAFAVQNPYLGEYVKTLSESDDVNIEKALINSSHFLIEESVQSKRQILSRYKKDLRGDELEILIIKKQSPLEIVFAGISIAMAAAVIFSGGKFTGKIGSAEMSFEVNSLGKGLEDLQGALAKRDERMQLLEQHIQEELPPQNIYIAKGKDKEEKLKDEVRKLQEAKLVKGLDDKTIKWLDSEIKKRIKKLNK